MFIYYFIIPDYLCQSVYMNIISKNKLAQKLLLQYS